MLDFLILILLNIERHFAINNNKKQTKILL